MHMDRPDNLKIFLGHHINYLSIWPFMCHPWFPTRKASKLTFTCFQLQLSSPCNVFNTWCWKQVNVNFEAFLVGNQGWRIKGQMLRKFIWYPKSIFRFIRPSMCISKRIKWIKKKGHREKKIFCIFFQSTHQVGLKNVVKCYKHFFCYCNALKTHSVILSFQKRLMSGMGFYLSRQLGSLSYQKVHRSRQSSISGWRWKIKKVPTS